ncbi:cytosolic iron-sulfur protein assembly [Borealophlyctis nickersoniae]|nr:cytosolic iron-sulfur protein assembly [Borealophlyctis nickersoniae]
MPRLELVAELTGHTDRVWQVSWHPTTAVLASCSGDKSVKIWKRDPPSGTWVCVDSIDDAHKRTIRSVAFAPSGKFLATASFDASTAIWEKEGDGGEFECVATLEGHENEVKSVAWSTSGALLATCSRDKSVWIWEVVGDSDFECLSVLQEHEQDVKMIEWHPNEELLASASYDDTVKIWREDDDDWYCSDTLRGHTSTVWAVDFNQTGDTLASVSDDRSMKFWRRGPPDAESQAFRRDPKWRCIGTIANLHKRTIFSVTWSKVHGRIASAGADDTVRILEEVPSQVDGEIAFKTAAVLERPHGQSDVNCARWCPLEGEDSNLLATTGDDGVVRIWRYVV